MTFLETMPLVSVILVNWNNHEDTLSCVESILKSSYKNVCVIIVDNGSESASVNALKTSQNNYKLILSPINTGFTGGNNIGIKYALSTNADYIFILNNDTLVDYMCIERLLVAASKMPKSCIVTPKIFFYPEKELIWAAGTTFNWRLLMGLNRGYKKIDSNIYDAPKKLNYAVGCAMLIEKSIINNIGLLTEDYFATWEDVDYGLRVGKHGYEILYEPSATVWHRESSSAGGTDNPQYVYYQTRSALIFKKRWAKNWFNFFIAQLHYLTYCSFRISKFILNRNFRGVLAIMIAYFDALYSRLGNRTYSILSK